MGNRATFRLHSFDLTGPADAQIPVEETAQDNGNTGALSHAGSTLSTHGTATSAIDLALDLVINEIAQQARLATNATGAAIALGTGGKIVCRATAGATAPDVAALLNAPSGIADACLQTGCAQRCDDTETDPRFDAVACRRLGVRSIVIVPVQSPVVSLQDKKADRLGIIAIFSPCAQGFGDGDVRKLQALSRRVVANIDRAKVTTLASAAAVPAEPTAGGPQPELPARHFEFRFPKLEFRVPLPQFRASHFEFRIPRPQFRASHFEFRVPRPQFRASHFEFRVPRPQFRASHFEFHIPRPQFRTSHFEFRIPYPQFRFPHFRLRSQTRDAGASTHDRPLFLTLTVIALALLLGWMLGWRAGVGRAMSGSKAKLGRPSVAPLSRTEPPHPAPQVDAVIAQTASENARPGATVQPRSSSSSSSSKAESSINEISSGSLVVYESGKVVYRVQPTPQPRESATDLGTLAQAPAARRNRVSTSNVLISEEMANTYLVQRVEPQYPSGAREQHVQGAVVLGVIVGEDGAVQAVNPISGDAQLVRAATDAVRRWRFTPLLRDGQHMKFETRITLNFVLQ